MRDIFDEVVNTLGMDVAFDEDSELYIATKEASDGSMTMSSNFDDIFEVSYFNKSGEYIGGFLINDEQYEELWEAEVIVDEFYLFLCD